MRYYVLLTRLIPGKAYEIEEDPDVSALLPFFFFRPFRIHIDRISQWEAYDLGRAPDPGSGADLSRADHGAVVANLELARGLGSRYLVQRWGDGTVCDKTGKRREIEVQVGSPSPKIKRVVRLTHANLYVRVARPSSTVP